MFLQDFTDGLELGMSCALEVPLVNGYRLNEVCRLILEDGSILGIYEHSETCWCHSCLFQ